MNVLFVPSIGLDATLIERLAQSVDYPVRYKMALNNGPPGALNEFNARHRDWIVKEAPTGNKGVAGSWNWAADLFSFEPCWLMVNEDAWFPTGYLETICKCADTHCREVPAIMLNETNAFYCFVWTMFGIEQAGLFDENFWVAYYEDADMRVRHKLRGLKYAYALMGKPPVPHGKPALGGVNYGAMIQGMGLFNRAYWLKKWGSMDYDNPAHKNPYRDTRLSPSEWVFDRHRRNQMQPIWETFMAQPKPSIYT